MAEMVIAPLPADISLRPAQAADRATIHDLVQANQLNPLSLKWQHFIVAANSSGQIVGIGQIKTHSDGSRELASIAVVPTRRRQGIAQAIILQLLQSNQPPLYLTCRAAMGSFYAHFGFAEVSIEQMPPYFRRIYRLARVMMRAARRETQMLVMGWLACDSQDNKEESVTSAALSSSRQVLPAVIDRSRTMGNRPQAEPGPRCHRQSCHG